MRVIFMGSPPFAVPSLGALVAAGHDVCLAVTQPPRAAGRGKRQIQPPVALVAESLGIPLFQPARIRAPEAVHTLQMAGPEVIVVAAYGQILPTSVLALPTYGCVNVHPSLLPRHRGASPIAGAILAGDDVSGVSIMLMDEGMDTGPVLSQLETPVDSADDQVSLTARLADLGASLLVTTLSRWVAHEVEPTAQDPARATTTRLVTRADGALDWNDPASVLSRRVRAYAEWPQGHTLWEGRSLRIRTAHADETASAEPGRVIPWGRPARVPLAAAVGTGSGVLVLEAIGLEGRQLLPIDVFLRGQLRIIGALLRPPSPEPTQDHESAPVDTRPAPSERT